MKPSINSDKEYFSMLHSRRDTLVQRLMEIPEFKELMHIEGILAGNDAHAPGYDSRSSGVTDTRSLGSIHQSEASPDELREIAHQVLCDLGRPIPIKELLYEVRRRGVRVKGSNPSAYLSTQLSRDERFVTLGREGWELESKLDTAPLIEAASQLATEVKSQRMLVTALVSHRQEKRYGLPQEIDRRLLEIASTILNRRLTDVEKPRLRDLAAEKLAHI